MINSKCKICRRQGTKLFLKGERCLSVKCAMVKKSYPPGQKGKRRFRGLSEYGRELREKQRLKNWYNLKERQLKRYITETLKKRGESEDLANLLLKRLESRLDNVIFRLGLAESRPQARQMVSHGHFLVNKKKVDIPSYQVKKGDKVGAAPSSLGKEIFKRTADRLKKYQPPSWLKINPKKVVAEVVGEPNIEEAQPPAEVHLIFEFYSR